MGARKPRCHSGAAQGLVPPGAAVPVELKAVAVDHSGVASWPIVPPSAERRLGGAGVEKISVSAAGAAAPVEVRVGVVPLHGAGLEVRIQALAIVKQVTVLEVPGALEAEVEEEVVEEEGLEAPEVEVEVGVDAKRGAPGAMVVAPVPLVPLQPRTLGQVHAEAEVSSQVVLALAAETAPVC